MAKLAITAYLLQPGKVQKVKVEQIPSPTASSNKEARPLVKMTPSESPLSSRRCRFTSKRDRGKNETFFTRSRRAQNRENLLKV